jgi:soluble lytic murein transglycosylase
MSTRAHPATRPPASRPPATPRRPATSRRDARRAVRRRRFGLALGVALVALLVGALSWPRFHDAVQEIALPLRHEDIIRQQAAEKDLDAALIAAVIYAESRFRDGQTSHAGAQGLMQVTPATARDIARKSGGTRFQVEDLHDPDVNIAYGAYHLRYLLGRYGTNETFAIAAYNAGEGNVDRWIAAARRANRDLEIGAIPFPETRAYVRRVQEAQRQYRASYAAELGLG